MLTKIYLVEDENVLDAYFGEDADPKSFYDLGAEHGRSVFYGQLDVIPAPEDTIVIDEGFECMVIVRVFVTAGTGEDQSMGCCLIVHPRFFSETLLS